MCVGGGGGGGVGGGGVGGGGGVRVSVCVYLISYNLKVKLPALQIFQHSSQYFQEAVG